MTEIETLREELNKLRERVAVLEARADVPVRDGHPTWVPMTVTSVPSPLYPPFIVT